MYPNFFSAISRKWVSIFLRVSFADKYTKIFIAIKMKIFNRKSDIFLNFALHIDCGYTLEPPRRGGSNEYPQPKF